MLKSELSAARDCAKFQRMRNMKKTVLLLFLVVMDTGRSMNTGNTKQSSCERITIPMCQNIGYNYTTFPNMFNHRTQTEASLALHQYIPLVDWVCYKWLPKFLCSIFVPVCTNTSVIIPPCRSFCEQSKEACLTLMRAFGDVWPSRFNCANFPEEGSKKLCITENMSVKDISTNTSTKQRSNSTREIFPQTTIASTTLNSHTKFVTPTTRSPKPDSKCREDEFQCEKYDFDHAMCIPKIWRCDGMDDCKDSSDERLCPTRITTTTIIPTTTKGPTTGLTCQRISNRIRNLCGRWEYTHTRLPNRFGHTNQDQVIQALGGWWKAVRKQCSPLLASFLCRVHVPPCGQKNQTKTPCRSMCKKVKKSCRRTLKRLKMKWPASLRCSKLPKKRCYGAVHKNILPKKVKPSKDNCEKISIKMCQGIGYNYTKFPNMFNQRNQAQVDIEVYQYLPLIGVQCSSYLKMFLCSMYVPICTKTKDIIPPCRSLCEHSRKGCEPLMKKYGFGWPAKFNCANFPKFGEGICVA